MDGSVRVRVPATSANLGPGFDALGLALSLHDVVEACTGRPGLTIEVTGQGEATARAGESHLVVRAMRETFGLLDGQPPGLVLRCANRIPHGRGLGSSAAAIVSGILAARALVDGGAERLPASAVLRLASELEGHPDNVAACLLGGLTIAWTGTGGAQAIQLSPLPTVVPVILVAPEPLATETARGVLPESVPHADAAANAARSALLVAALTSEPGTLLEATRDWLHQPYRSGVMPVTADLVRRLRAAGVPAVVSGAGPSVLAFLVRTHSGGASLDAVDSTIREMGIEWDISALDVDRRGASIQSVTPGSVPAGSTPQ
ncbi:MAG: homoserine kinase [Streptosporangiaceae bacterium]|jgi:homoserine kinase